MSVVIKTDNVNKSFHVGTQDIQVLKGISFEIKSGDFSIIFGPSGCGKSTLLHGLLGLEAPTSGSVTILDKNLYLGTSEDDRSEFRKNHIGMVYQQPNWIKSLTVIENIRFPLLLKRVDPDSALLKAHEVLKRVEMDDWADYLPSELSSGQQQRVALGRAIITNPEIIIADEPTGNLDFEAGQMLMQLLQDLNQKEGKTIIMVTHDLEYLQFAKSGIKIFDGKVEELYSDTDKKGLMTQMKSKRGQGELQSKKQV